MNNLKITLFHPTLDLLSDRTLRELLKKLSSLSREIQAREVLHLVDNSFLGPREKQSIRDRIQPDLSHIPAYYIEEIEKGSLKVVMCVTSFAIWLLQITIGKSIEEGWKKTRFNEDIVEYLSSDRRRETIERNIDVVRGKLSTERFLIDDIQMGVDESGDINVKIFLKTQENLEEYIKEKEQKVDIDFVIKNADKIILDLKKQSDEDAQ